MKLGIALLLMTLVSDTARVVPVCNVSILLNGDSTAWGYAAGGGGARASVYPELALQRAMDARFGRGVIAVRTGAVSGSTSVGALLQPRDADIVVYNSGINDVAHRVIPEEYRLNLRKLAKVPGAVFQTPTPVWNRKSYDAAMREVAAEAGVPLIDAHAWALRQPDWWKIATDGVHPTSEGYESLANDLLMPSLARLVWLRCKLLRKRPAIPS
jgi:lysophospholipase L1-like esterase